MEDVVVLIPGIGGSVLTRGTKDIWAPTPGAALRAVLSLGRSIKDLTLPNDDPEADHLDDGVVASGLLPDFHVLPGLDWRIDGYGRIADYFRKRHGCEPGRNYFEFPYDWRRDIRVAARKLAHEAEQWLARWQVEAERPHAKLVLVGHSMGGLVARTYLELHEGWRNTRSLITFGTPYAGSVNALEFLANGFKKEWGPFTLDLTEMLRSFTSVYQLLPSYRCVEGPDGTWLNLDEVDWTGSDLEVVRLQQAVDFHRNLRQKVDERRARDGAGYAVRPVTGTYQRTLWAVRRNGLRVETLAVRGIGEKGGDGTVPWMSAVPHEYLADMHNVAFFGQRHASLQNDDAVLQHLAGLLHTTAHASTPVLPAVEELELEVDHVTAGEPFVVSARPKEAQTQLLATVEPAEGGAVVNTPLHPASDGWHRATLTDVPPGDYRVTVLGGGVHPVTDVASVVDLSTLDPGGGSG